MSLIKKAKSVVNSVKKKLTTSSDRAAEARKQYTNATTSDSSNRIVESVKHLTSSAKPQQSQRAGNSYYNTSIKENIPNRNISRTSITSRTSEYNRGETRNPYNVQGSFKNALNTSKRFYRAATNFFSRPDEQYFKNNPDAYRKWEIIKNGTKQDVAHMNDPVPKNMHDLAHNMAVAANTNSAEKSKLYANNALDVNTHKEIIDWYKDLFSEEAINAYLDYDHVDLSDPASVAEYNRKLQAVYDYFDGSVYSKRTIDDIQNMSGDKILIEGEISKNALPPPWMPQDATSASRWIYGRDFAWESNTVQIEEAARAKEMYDLSKKHQYKIASDYEGRDAINSLGDALLYSDNKLSGLKDYVVDYWVNPFLAQDYGTWFFNHLYSAGDTIDMLTRYPRAMLAGFDQLGGTTDTGHIFKGQHTYWADIEGYKGHRLDQVKDAQTVFMKNGGLELLNRKHHRGKEDAYANSRYSSMSDEDILASINSRLRNSSDITAEQLLDAIESQYFKGTEVDRLVSGLQQGWQNVKEAYEHPGSTFVTDTGNLAADVAIEVAVDPSTWIQGGAKTVLKEGIRNASEEAFTTGLKSVGLSEVIPQIRNNKKVNQILKSFKRSNQITDAPFRDAKKLSGDVDLLENVLVHEFPEIFDNSGVRKKFHDTLMAELIDDTRKLNSEIIASTARARRHVDSKIFKSAYYANKAFDYLDSAILKTSFIEPYALVKGTKFLANPIVKYTALGNAIAYKQQKLFAGARTVMDSYSERGIVYSVTDLLTNKNALDIGDKAVRRGMFSLGETIDFTSSRISLIKSNLASGRINVQQARTALEEALTDLLKGDVNSIDDLGNWVAQHEKGFYFGIIQDSYSKLQRTYDDLFQHMAEREGVLVSQFFDSLAIVDSEEALEILFKQYLHRIDLDSLTERIQKVIPSEFKDTFFQTLQAIKADPLNSLDINMQRVKAAEKQIMDTVNYSSIHRTVKVGDLKTYLNNRPDLSRAIKSSEFKNDKGQTHFYYLNELRGILNSRSDVSTEDILRAIDRAHFSSIPKIIAEQTAITKAGEQVAGEHTKVFKELIDFRDFICNRDLISTKDASIVSSYSLDMWTAYDSLKNNESFRKLTSDIRAILDAPLNKYRNNDLDDAFIPELNNVNKTLRFICDHIEQGDAFDVFKNNISSIQGITDNQVYAVLSGLQRNFGFGDRVDLIDELTRDPNGVSNWLRSFISNEIGESVLGIPSLTNNVLKSVDTAHPHKAVKPFIAELQDPNNVDLKQWWDAIADGDADDAEVYATKQALLTILMGSKTSPTEAVREYNARAKDAPLYFVHNTATGLNEDISTITSIGYFKWNPITIKEGEEVTLRQIHDAFQGQSGIFRAFLSDEAIDSIPQDVLTQIYRNSDINPKSNNLRELFRDSFGAKGGEVKDEGAILSDFLDMVMYDSSKQMNLGRVFNRQVNYTATPTFVVHDLESSQASKGFNMRFFSAAARRNVGVGYDNIDNYVNFFERDILDKTKNSYETFRNIYNDDFITPDVQKEIEKFILYYAEDTSKLTGDRYTVSSLFEFFDAIKSLQKQLQDLNPDDYHDTIIKDLINGMRSEVISADIKQTLNSIKEYSVLENYAKQITVFSTSHKGLTFSAETANRLMYDSNGQKLLGRASKDLDIDRALLLFDIGDISDGIKLPMDSLNRMYDFSDWVLTMRDKNVSSKALAFLTGYKNTFDSFILAAKNMVVTTADGRRHLDYLKYITLPDTPIESYLVAQKIYDDVYKYSVEGLKKKLQDLPPWEIKKYENSILSSFVEGFNPSAINVEGAFDEVLPIFEGRYDSLIYKNRATSEKTLIQLIEEDDVYMHNIDLYTKVQKSMADVRNHIGNKEYIRQTFAQHGLKIKDDVREGMSHQNAYRLYDKLTNIWVGNEENAKRIGDTGACMGYVRAAGELRYAKIQRHLLNRLKVNDVFDKDRLLQEIITNGFNGLKIRSTYHAQEDLDALDNLVQSLHSDGIDFVLSRYDRQSKSYWIWLDRSKVDVLEDRTSNEFYLRFIDDATTGYRYKAPKYEGVAFPTLDEVFSYCNEDVVTYESVLNALTKYDPQYRELHEALRLCWESADALSGGKSLIGTGKALNTHQIDQYLASIPSFMADTYISPKGYLEAEMRSEVIFDPGFVTSPRSQNIALDFKSVMDSYSTRANDTYVMAETIMNTQSSLDYHWFVNGMSEREIIDTFGYDSDFVVCTLVPNSETYSGLELKQVKLNEKYQVSLAANMQGLRVIPYELFAEMHSAINVATNSSSTSKFLRKALVVMKAFQLCNVGTWVQNYTDALTKAAVDMGEGSSNVVNLLKYQRKALKDISDVKKIIKQNGDIVDKKHWDFIASNYKLDMTYDEYELLLGMLQGSQYTSVAGKAYGKINKARKIGGDTLTLRNLEESDIKRMFNRFASDSELDYDTFYRIYTNTLKPDNVQQILFDQVMKKLSVATHSARPWMCFDNAVRSVFKPFSITEEVARYTQLLYLRDIGMVQNSALKRIQLTQFESRVSMAMNKMEIVRPFIRNAIDNVSFWGRLIDENPRIFRYFENLYAPIYRDNVEASIDAGQEYDFSNDYMLQSGGIPIGGTGLYFKLDPSVIQALEMFYGDMDTHIHHLNPLAQLAIRHSFDWLGFGSNYYFRDMDLDFTDESAAEQIGSVIPIVNTILRNVRTYNVTSYLLSDDSTPAQRLLYTALSTMVGIQKFDKDGSKIGFDVWRDSLEEQGKWYDCNTGSVRPLSEKNYYGANDPDNTFEDVQYYQLTHFGKLWDANQQAYVKSWEYQAGGFNERFDFEADPTAWDRLNNLYKGRGMKFDYNTHKFIPISQWKEEGLNDTTISFDERRHLMWSYFGLKWDSNQGDWVEPKDYMAGGLNNTSNFGEVISLRRALLGEEYDYINHKFYKAHDPQIVIIRDMWQTERSDNYYKLLGVPLLNVGMLDGAHLNSDGLIVTKKGEYMLLRDNDYNARVFAQFPGVSFRSKGKWRDFNYQYYVWKTLYGNKKPWAGRTYPDRYYTGVGWNEEEGYYRLAYEKNYQYHSSEPISKLHRLIAPPRVTPFNNLRGKFYFQNRY